MTVNKKNGNPRIKIIRDGGHLLPLKLGFMILKLNLDIFGIQIDKDLSKTLLTSGRKIHSHDIFFW